MSSDSPYLIPLALRDAVDELRRQPLADPDDLRRRVTAYIARVRSVAAGVPEVDLDRAERVARICLALLDDWPTLAPEQRGWVQAACGYFVRAEDDEDDFVSVVGFDDDDEVVDHVLANLRRTDLRDP